MTLAEKLIRRGAWLASAAMLTTLACPTAALAGPADYPSRPVKMIVPLAAGGGGDIIARLVAQGLSEVLGQSFVVENRPGGNGNIGTQLAAQAKPDGYTLLVGAPGPMAVNQYLYSSLPYDPAKDFAPISLLALYDNVVVVPADSSIKDFKGLLDAARANPGKLNYGIAATGSSSHLAVEKLKHDANINIAGVPYSSHGSTGATTDLIAGRLQFSFDVLVSQYSNITSGKLRPLATTGSSRSPYLPDVPTLEQSGFPGFTAVGFAGLFAPAGTPKPIVDKLADAVKKAFETPTLQKIKTPGMTLQASTPQEFDDFLVKERIKWSKVIRDANIHME
jgi:tripartite-type tricarboxylate transporter receptor subunit TctC